MASEKKILVIGGGIAGLGSIRALKEEGFDPVCYEKTSGYGGTWNYRQNILAGVPTVMPTTVINHSKEMGAVSNCTADRIYPNYMRHDELFKIMTEIAGKFGCLKHIIFNREVLKVKLSVDYDKTGRWDVESKNRETGEIFYETFDGVMVCVGQFGYPKMPSYPGMEKFKGTILHTHDLKEVYEFKNKKVVVVGMGCSGIDAAVDLSNVASKVYISTRSGAWILPRIGPFGMPFDLFSIRRYLTYIQKVFGWRFSSWYLEKYVLNARFDHKLYNVKPKQHVLSKDPVISDVFPAKVISGKVKIRKDIKYFTEKGVIFENESEITEIDAVVMATGYKWKFSFLEEGTVTTEGKRLNLYKCMYPPHLKHKNLVIIGLILPFGPGFPLGELQTRWAAQVFSGKCLLPSEKEMMAEIKNRYERKCKRYGPSEKNSLRVDFIEYADDIASEFGAKPCLWKLLFTDPKLYWALLFGPALPYQYRLQGPHKWDGAREAILTAYDRIHFPFNEEEKTEFQEDVHLKYVLKLQIE